MKALLIGIVVSAAVVGAGLALRRPTVAASEKPQPVSGGSLRLWSEDAKGYVVLPPVAKPEAEWKAQLTSQQFQVARKAGTERAFTGALWNEHRKGIYRCVACGTDLFRSDAKFESGTGWPSFWQPIAPENIESKVDRSWLMTRVEVVCRRCGSHLGHVFEDGPPPTGLRYCMNSAAMAFVPQAESTKK